MAAEVQRVEHKPLAAALRRLEAAERKSLRLSAGRPRSTHHRGDGTRCPCNPACSAHGRLFRARAARLPRRRSITLAATPAIAANQRPAFAASTPTAVLHAQPEPAR